MKRHCGGTSREAAKNGFLVCFVIGLAMLFYLAVDSSTENYYHHRDKEMDRRFKELEYRRAMRKEHQEKYGTTNEGQGSWTDNGKGGTFTFPEDYDYRKDW